MNQSYYTIFTPTPPVEAIRVGNKFFFKTADIKNLLKVKGVAE